MENTITLYNVPWVFEGRTQPYFATATSRDNYFSSLTGKQVNKVGVNITLLYNYEIELKVDLDITLVENYNFAVIVYNDKKYYANIIDSEQISVNRTKVYCKRNPLFEVINPFQYFEKFMIESATFYNLNFDSNPSFFFPKTLRTRPVYRALSCVYKLRDNVIEPTVNFIPTAVLVLGKSISSGDLPYTQSYDQSNFFVYLIPLKDGTYSNSSGVTQKFTILPDQMEKTIAKLSPYTLKFNIMYLPYSSVNKTFMGYGGFVKIPNTDYYTYNLYENTSTYYIFTLSGQDYLEYSTIDFLVYSPNNILTIEPYKYCNGLYDRSFECDVYLHFNFDPSGISIISFVKGNNYSSFNSDDILCTTFNISTDKSFCVDQESLFAAENSYYNELTAVNKKQILNLGTSQAVSEVGVGLVQIAAGAGAALETFGTGGIGEAVMGGGNVIRGISTALDTSTKIEAYEKTRALEAAQEKNKPPKCNVSSSSYFDNWFFNYNEYPIYQYFKVVYNTILPNDRETFLIDSTTYGIKCYKEEDSFNFVEHLVNGYFFVKCVAVCKPITSQLTTRQYSEIQRYLEAGCRYKYFS